MVHYLNMTRYYTEKDHDKAIESCKYVTENTKDFERRQILLE